MEGGTPAGVVLRTSQETKGGVKHRGGPRTTTKKENFLEGESVTLLLAGRSLHKIRNSINGISNERKKELTQ